ncbi:MAG: kynureninase, partial [Sulfobacillus sp.]
MPMFDASKRWAQHLDQSDILAKFREEFYLDGRRIYLDGNSLGLLSKRAHDSLLDLVHSWRQLGIDGWSEGSHPWFYLSEQLGDMMAPLVGADSGEVIATGSTTINLHQLVSTFYQPSGHRNKILADQLTFPSDIYALKSQLQQHGFDPDQKLIRVPSQDGWTLRETDLIDAMNDDVALVILPSVLYKSGQLLNVEALTHAAHERNILIGFDLAHSVGAVPHHLTDWGVDFAFWCTYKYLNGGPGSVGGLYVHKKHWGAAPGLAGWFSSKKSVQFDM